MVVVETYNEGTWLRGTLETFDSRDYLRVGDTFFGIENLCGITQFRYVSEGISSSSVFASLFTIPALVLLSLLIFPYFGVLCIEELFVFFGVGLFGLRRSYC